MLEECHTSLPALIHNDTGTKTDIGQAKDPNMSTHNYIHLIFNKDAKKYTLEKRHYLQQSVLEILDVNI